MLSLVVHGGAWQIPKEELDAHREGLRAAMARGISLLLKGSPAIEVVVETIAILEDDPTFDAGRGSVLNLGGGIEMDASVMDGSTMRAGCVACVSDVANPIRLAQAIMDDGRAVMLSGEGASAFARSVGIPACAFADLLVDRETRRKGILDRVREYRTRRPFDGSLAPPDGPHPKTDVPPPAQPLGTVGAVCCDSRGRLAAATSTGGAPNTLPGRVGDSPVLGAGTWAEDGVGAAGSTGWGKRSSEICSPSVRCRRSTRSRSPGRNLRLARSCGTPWRRNGLRGGRFLPALRDRPSRTRPGERSGASHGGQEGWAA